MDIGVKERVIGAVVLVVLGIIIIPWVLQGPAPDSTVTHKLPLPTASTSTGPAEYRMDLNTPATQAGTVAAPVAAAPESGSSQPKQIAPVPHAAQAQAIERAPASSKPHPVVHGGWMIQAGSYASRSNAQRLQKTLEEHNYQVTISPHISGGKTYYRVWIGPYTERSSAERALPAINHIYSGKAKVVTNG